MGFAIIFGFYAKRFLLAFVIGIIFRLIIALLFRQDEVSVGGFVRTGLFFGVVYCILLTYILY
jgi:hypothetical protein